MKRVTAILLLLTSAMTALAHDCENDRRKKDMAPAATAIETQAVDKSTGKEEPTGNAKDEKSNLQKFLDHPPASKSAKKRMNKR